MSGFENGGTQPIPCVDPDVMRGKVVFRDGSEMGLSYYRYGREVDHFEMDGVRYVAVPERDWDDQEVVD